MKNSGSVVQDAPSVSPIRPSFPGSLDLSLHCSILLYSTNKITTVFYPLNSLINGATYEEEDGVKSLYLSGSGAYATTPAVDFGKNSFTIASWVKLQSPANVISIIYSDWSSPFKFIVDAYDPSGRLHFGGMNNKGQYHPWLCAG